MIATGLKKWNPTTRSGCFRSAAISVTEQRRCVGGQYTGLGHDGLALGENLLLDLQILENGLDDEVGVREGRLVRGAADQSLEAVGLVLVDPASGQELVDLAVDVGDALVDPLLIEVGHDHGDLQTLDEQQCHLTGHQPGPHHTDLVHRTRQGLVRGADRALGPLLDEVERVQPRPEFVTHDEVGQRFVLGGESCVGIGCLGRGHEVHCANRGGCRAVQLRIETGAHGVHCLVPTVVAGDLGSIDDDLARHDTGGPQQGPLDEVRGLEHRVRDAEVQNLLGLQHAVLRKGVCDDDLERLLGADQVREEPRAAPAGHKAEEALGQGDGGCAGADGPVVAVQRQFEPATHGGPVDEGEGGDGEVGEPAKHLVSEFRDAERHLT